MKKELLIVFILATFIAPSCWGSDKADYNASVIAMDSIINYYSSMAELGNTDQSGKLDCKKRMAYFCKNRDMLITQIARTKTFSHLARAHQICENSYQNSAKHLPYSKAENCVAGKSYFDTLTGHRYIKRDDKTYAEYTKKGVFLKTIASDQPLLNRSRNIHLISQDSYILYKKYCDGKTDYLSLPGSEAHPKGWKADKILVSLN